MVFRVNQWSWKATATRLLLAPILAAGTVASVHAQSYPPPPRAASTPVSAPAATGRPTLPSGISAPPTTARPLTATPTTASRTKDPKALLQMGRDALKAGRYDEAQTLARQADANNTSGRWGLFDDTPESLEKDIRSARAKADKAQATQLSQQAKAAFDTAMRTPNDAQRLIALEQAYQLADRAVTLTGPSDVWGDLFGSDRPEKLRKEIDAVRAPLRKKVSPAEIAKLTPTPAAKPNTPVASSVKQVGANTPATPVANAATAANTQVKTQAAKLVAEGRMLMKQGRLVEARTKAVEAGRVRVQFAVNEDTPDLLMRDVMSEAKTMVDRLTRDAEVQIRNKHYERANAALESARGVAAGMGFQTRPIEEQLAVVQKAMGVAPSTTPLTPTDPKLATMTPPSKLSATTPPPTNPAVPANPIQQVAGKEPAPSTVPAAGLVVPAMTLPPPNTSVASTPSVPSLPAPSLPSPVMPPPVMPTTKPADPVATAPLVVPAVPGTSTSQKLADPVAVTPPIPSLPSLNPTPVVPAPAPTPVASTPSIPPLAPVAPAPAPVVPLADPIARNPVTPPPSLPSLTPPASPAMSADNVLADATRELQRGDLEMARKLASQAHQLGAKDDAQKLMREIDATANARKQKDATTAFNNAVELFQAKQYDQAFGVLQLLDPAMLTQAQRTQLPGLVEKCSEAMAKVNAAPLALPIATADPTKPLTPTEPAKPTAGLADQVKALSEVEFQRLRSEGLETETKARQAFDRGETDLAIQMLSDFTTKVKGSNLTAGRQNLLLSPVDRRLESFRIMKRQMDFYTKEARDKKDARERIVGRSVVEQQKKEEIAKKVREVNELVKAHKNREAEALALQLKSLEPEDPTLSALYELTKRHRAVDNYAKIKDDKEKMFLDGLNSAEKQGKFLDVDNPVSVDVERSLNAMRRGDGSELYTRTRTAKEREIELKLDRPFTVEFKNKPLREVLGELRQKAGVNITTDDAAIGDEQISLDTVSVTESVEDLSLRNILTILLDKARLKYVVENDVIRVTTEKKAKGRLYTKVFSVMELVTPVPDFALADHQNINKVLQKASNPMPAWQSMSPGGAQVYNPNGGGLPGGELVAGGSNLAPGGGSPFAPQAGTGVLQNMNNGVQVGSGGAPMQSRLQSSALLQKLITGMVRPYSWQDLGGAGKIDYYDIGGALVVNQTADVIREVQDLLDALRRLQDLSLTVEVRVISLSESFFERVGVDFAVNIKTKGTGNFEQQLTSGAFRPEPFLNDIHTSGTTVGWNPSQGGFTPDLDVPIRPNSFGFGVPPFGGYPGPNPNGGLSLGLAFLNDIQVFMFLEAAQGDRRVNVMQAPKITLFNGQTSTVSVNDTAFFTTGLQVINVGGQIIYLPQNTPSPTAGVNLTVQGVVSADRKYVRLTLSPILSEITSATIPLFPVTAFITPVFEGGSQGVPIPFTQFFQQPSFTTISVQTTVQVPDGGTVVMGGLKTMSEGRNEFGPPVISSIPYLNRLFRNQGIGRETKHIMIMVTPRIVINAEEELNQTGQGGSFAPGTGPAGN